MKGKGISFDRRNILITAVRVKKDDCIRKLACVMQYLKSVQTYSRSRITAQCWRMWTLR